MNGKKTLYFLSVLYVVVVSAFVFLPIALVILFSFSDRGITAFPFGEPTLKWFTLALEDAKLANAIANSLLIGASSSAVAILVGLPAAYAIARFSDLLTRFSAAAIGSPLVVPHLLIGIAILSFVSAIGGHPSIIVTMFAHVTIVLPFVVFSLAARIAGIPPEVSEAGSVLGAAPLRVLCDIWLPMILRSIVGAFILSVAWSFDEFVVSFFTIGIDNTLPILIWGQMRSGVTPVINVASTVFVLVAAILVIAASKLFDTKLH